MVRLGSLATFETRSAPDRVPRYNLFPTAEIIGSSVASVSSGTTLDLVENIAAKVLPEGFSTEWTELSYPAAARGRRDHHLSPECSVRLPRACVAVRSWSLPFAVILIVPMSLLSAMGGVMWVGHDNNVLTQVGLIVLVGLAAKNAILIVEFARHLEAQGRSIVDAVVEASRLLLRPILMTSLAFILGAVPLMIAQARAPNSTTPSV